MQFRRRLSVLLATATLAAGLSGCVAIPPAITLASLGVDLGSFALTGKTASDHVLSAVAGEDCRLAGVFDGEICREDQEFEAALAVLEPLPGETQVASAAAAGEARKAPQLAADSSTQTDVPPGFKVPSGTVVSEEAAAPEPPVGGFSFGDGKVRALPQAQTAAPRAAVTGAVSAEAPDLADFLSDEALPRASTSAMAQQLAEHLGSADFLSQASLDTGARF